MKKIMITAAIVCAAVFAHGAAIDWSSTANYVTSDGVVQTAGTADVGTFVLVYLGNGSANWDGAIVVNEGTVAFGAAKGVTAAKVSGSYSFNKGATGAPVDGDIFAVMFKDDKGNLSKLQSAGSAIENTLVVSGLNDADDRWSKDFSFATSNFSVAPTDVPEPTSGLLLVVGGALLALRRRRA